MQKTPDEIKKGLKCCNTGKSPACEFCSYKSFELGPHGVHYVNYHCEQLQIDSLAYIQQLESTYGQVSKALCGKENATAEEIIAAFDQVKRERVALLNIIKHEATFFSLIPLPCRCCKNIDDAFTSDVCRSCAMQGGYGGFEWCGVQDIRTGASDSCTGASDV